jgi:hypothetical protein
MPVTVPRRLVASPSHGRPTSGLWFLSPLEGEKKMLLTEPLAGGRGRGRDNTRSRSEGGPRYLGSTLGAHHAACVLFKL